MTKKGRWLTWAGVTTVLSLAIAMGSEYGKSTGNFVLAMVVIGAVLWVLFVWSGHE